MSTGLTADASPVRTAAQRQVPRLAEGVRLLGGYEGSGFREQHYLLERGDGQIVHVTRLLFLVVANIDGRRDLEEIATIVSAQYGRPLGVDGLCYVIETKLAPLGLTAVSAPAAAPPRAEPILSLAARGVLVPARWVQAISAALAPLFSPAVVAAVLVALAAVDWWVFARHGLGAAQRQVLADPVLLLPLLGTLVVSTLFHEFGHAAGCRYSGGRPGVIGVGLYLFYPAFYTNVTDAYRLDRAGRLRTDLGGIYFNGVFVVAVASTYFATGYEPLLLLVLLVHLEIIQQLLPIVRLDGYFILADLVGVPDLFGRVRPILSSMVPGRRLDPRVSELRRGTRIVVTAWVVVVVPLLAGALVVLLVQLPGLLVTTWHSALDQWALARAAVRAGDIGSAVGAGLSVLLLALPVAGLAVLLWRLAVRLARLSWHLLFRPLFMAPAGTRHLPRDATMNTDIDNTAPGKAGYETARPDVAVSTMQLPASAAKALSERRGVQRLTAASFTEENMLRPRGKPPSGGWRRVVYRASGGHITVGPSAAEVRERELIARVRTPFTGSRRVAVLCRKGGAGKTTTTLMLGHAFARHRGDRIVALDANPDAGSLGHRVHRQTGQTVTSLLADREALDKYADLRAYTSQASDTRLEIVASDDDPRITQALGEVDYHYAVGLLERHYNLILLDTGTGILDDAIQGILREADQLIVVVPPALDGARVAASTLDWLDEHNQSDLVQSAVAVINSVRGTELVDLDRVEEHFAARCAAVARIPWDPALDAGAQTSLDELRPATREAYLHLAAAVADGFGTRSPRIR